MNVHCEPRSTCFILKWSLPVKPFVFQNGGSNLCAVDDSNDHVLSVWDWQREERLADVKVCPRLCWAPRSVPHLEPSHPTGSRPLSCFSLGLWAPIPHVALRTPSPSQNPLDSAPHTS